MTGYAFAPKLLALGAWLIPAAIGLSDPATGPAADVMAVQVSGEPGVRFEVTISSPDTGCEQYANWWEVLSESGELLYRRVLGHSHVDEQPFTRSGGPVEVEVDQVVLVRAHMHPTGYGGVVMKGSARAGFEVVEVAGDFAAEVEGLEPQPVGCRF